MRTSRRSAADSLALRSGDPMAGNHRQLRGISDKRSAWAEKVMSVPDGIGIAIEKVDAREARGVQQTC